MHHNLYQLSLLTNIILMFSLSKCMPRMRSHFGAICFPSVCNLLCLYIPIWPIILLSFNFPSTLNYRPNFVFLLFFIYDPFFYSFLYTTFSSVTFPIVYIVSFIRYLLFYSTSRCFNNMCVIVKATFYRL